MSEPKSKQQQDPADRPAVATVPDPDLVPAGAVAGDKVNDPAEGVRLVDDVDLIGDVDVPEVDVFAGVDVEPEPDDVDAVRLDRELALSGHPQAGPVLVHRGILAELPEDANGNRRGTPEFTTNAPALTEFGGIAGSARNPEPTLGQIAGAGYDIDRL